MTIRWPNYTRTHKNRTIERKHRTVYDGHPDLPAIEYEIERKSDTDYGMLFDAGGLGSQNFDTLKQADAVAKHWQSLTYCAAVSAVGKAGTWRVYVWADANTDETRAIGAGR